MLWRTIAYVRKNYPIHTYDNSRGALWRPSLTSSCCIRYVSNMSIFAASQSCANTKCGGYVGVGFGCNVLFSNYLTIYNMFLSDSTCQWFFVLTKVWTHAAVYRAITPGRRVPYDVITRNIILTLGKPALTDNIDEYLF